MEKLNSEQILLIIKITILIVSLFISFYTAKLYLSFKNRKNLSDAVIAWSKTLNNSSLMTQSKKEKTQTILSRQGIMYRLQDYELIPTTYELCRILCGVGLMFCSFIFFGINIAIMLIAFIIGYMLLNLIFSYLNKKDNFDMLDDIQNMYFTFIVYAEAGEYITETIRQCAKETKHPRLKEALNEFTNIVSTRKGSIIDAINVFKNRFDNKDITNLCVVMHQAESTGKSSKMLKDLLKQVEEMQAAQNYNDEKSAERKSMILLLLFFVGIILLIGVGLVTNVFNAYKELS